MKVQCAICDDIYDFDDNSKKAKWLKSRRLRTFLCQTCDDRIRENTLKRKETGKFKLYRDKKKPFFDFTNNDQNKETDAQ